MAREVAERLRGWGHAASTAHDHRLDEATDEQQFLFARAHGRVLITHNQRDFLLLHRAWLLWPVDLRLEWTLTHPGILLLEHGSPGMLAEALRRLLDAGPIARDSLHRWRRFDGWSRWRYRTDYEPVGVD